MAGRGRFVAVLWSAAALCAGAPSASARESSGPDKSAAAHLREAAIVCHCAEEMTEAVGGRAEDERQAGHRTEQGQALWPEEVDD
jgi:hypothetical protein|eukprot:420073-Prymnesium_polylepis.1